MNFDAEIKAIAKALEKISKRLRKVEVLARLSRTETVDTFLGLTDTPFEYDGYRGWAVVVNNNEDAVEFQPIGGACVTFVCGPVGWRGYGGAERRTLVHEVAFQLSADNNDRGAYAIDLQQETNAVTQVAGGDYSAILSGRRSVIGTDCLWSVIAGPYNEITDNSIGYIYGGCCNDIYDSSYMIHILGEGIDVEKGTYCLFSGEGHRAIKGAHDSSSAFGVWCFGEDNTFWENANDYVAYSGMYGIDLEMEGDVWLCHQFGEQNRFYGLGGIGTSTTLWNMQHGFAHYAQHVMTNAQFGRNTKSALPSATSDFYHGRVLNSGDQYNDSPTDGIAGYGGGFNQDSWFSQSDVITTWNVAWTTARFQFPIIQDSIWTFLIYISATERGCANSHSFKIEGCIENDGGNTTMLASTVTNIYRDVATKEIQAVADNANDRLAIQFRDTAGPDATWTNVQFSMFTVEVGAEV